MAQQIVNLGTLADGSDGDTNKVAWGKAKDNFAELYGRIVGKGYISGLQMKWVSATALTLTSGAAYIQGTGTVLYADSDIAKTGLSLSASTWYHVYVYDNAGTPDFVLSTTAPATAYNGTARSMTGDTSKRYAGSVKTDASGNIYAFRHYLEDGRVRYLVDLNTTGFKVVSGGTSATDATVNCSGVAPVTARGVSVFSENNAASGLVYLSNADIGTPANTHIAAFIRSGRTLPVDLPITSSQAFTYLATSPGTLDCYVTGYTFER